MCKQLAAQGFNICIMSRDKQKMEKVLAGLAGVETKAIVADFA